MYHKINHFKIYNLVAFNTITWLCSYEFYTITKHFIPKKKMLCSFNSYSP